MQQESMRKIRSSLIVYYYYTLNVITPNALDSTLDQVAGNIYIITDNSNEICVFTNTTPINRSDFLTQVSTLETSLSEGWFALPMSISQV